MTVHDIDICSQSMLTDQIERVLYKGTSYHYLIEMDLKEIMLMVYIILFKHENNIVWSKTTSLIAKLNIKTMTSVLC